mgnify:FL=1|tara:strand:+ start:88 stop:276 length:189 start_codon:yes stop_codon:yes gene_type:complete
MSDQFNPDSNMYSGDLEDYLVSLYRLGRKHMRLTDNNEHDKAAEIDRDADELIRLIVGEVFG